MGEVVLVVDDEPGMLRVVGAMLRRSGYTVITAADPFDALEQSRAFEGRIDLLLTDIVMSEMDGFVLANRLLAERRDLRVLLMSAFVYHSQRLPLLRKPFRLDELLKRVRGVIDGPVPSVQSAGTPAE